MSNTEIQFRRGNTAQNDNFTGADGEITVDQTTKEIVTHDGVKQGGYRQHNRDAIVSTLSDAKALDVEAGFTVETLGYNTKGDKGGTLYEVVSSGTGTDDGGFILDMDNGNQLRAIFGKTINVRQFGITGEGTSQDVLPLLKNLVSAVSPTGADVVFSDGLYYTPFKTGSVEADWVIVENDNVTFKAENKHGAVLENVLLLVRGSYGSSHQLLTDVKAGESSVLTATKHGFDKNSRVQLISCVSPYSTDAGEWQGGSLNPTNNTRPEAVFVETHTVSNAFALNEVSLYEEIIYDDVFNADTTGQSVTVTGITSSYIREIYPVKNFRCENLSFKREEGSGWQGIAFRITEDSGLFGCKFLTNDTDNGIHFRAEESTNITIKGCEDLRDVTGFGGSSWNSFIFGGGCSNIKIQGNTIKGGAQIFDITPLLSQSLLFGQSRDLGPDSLFMTCYGIEVSNNYFLNCSDSFTTHPATYKLNVVNNFCEGGSTGFRIRSKFNNIQGNNVRTRRRGVTCSAFYDHTNISGNIFKQIEGPDSGQWIGVDFTPMSSEIMNNNDVQDIIVSDNLISADTSGNNVALRNAVFISHVGNGVPPNASFSDFTDSVKTSLSNYTIVNNTIDSCSCKIRRYINGVTFEGNKFIGTSLDDHWIIGENQDCARHVLSNNIVDGVNNTFSVASLSDTTSISYPYAVKHSIGKTFSINRSYSLSVPTASYLSCTGSILEVHDGLTVKDGGTLKADRTSGEARLNISANPIDGTSRATVNINDYSATTDKRTNNYGIFIQNNGNMWPLPDNTHSTGVSAFRWSEVYAANGTINTSDGREKQDVRDLTETERLVANDLKQLIKAFRWKEAVKNKGDNARVHFGVIAQEVRDAFTKKGLDANNYGLFCYDEWDDIYGDEKPDGSKELLKEAGNRYGIRYEQLLAFIISTL